MLKFSNLNAFTFYNMEKLQTCRVVIVTFAVQRTVDQNPHSVPFSLCLAAVWLHLTQNCLHSSPYLNAI